MDLENFSIWLSAIILGIFAILHLIRIFKPFPVQIGSVEVPHWASYIGVVVAAFLSYFLFIAAGR